MPTELTIEQMLRLQALKHAAELLTTPDSVVEAAEKYLEFLTK